jgi:hypothetical protein
MPPEDATRRPNKGRRKEILRRLRLDERAANRAKLILSQQELEALHEYVEVRLEIDGCDETPRFTAAWAVERGRPVEPLFASLQEFGGYCDCEVVANVSPDLFGWPD